MKSDPTFVHQKTKEDFIEISDKDYPPLLKNIYDPPKILFFKGNKKLLHHKNLLTIVGSRITTSYHQTILKNIIHDLRNSNLVIVSGLANGIDALAHQYALENNLATIAVLGSSIDEKKLYPQSNLSLARKIIEQGGLLISEQSKKVQTQLWHFPKRNRILAGLSKASLIVSGKQKSGTLITAQVAIDEGREVLAIPANINMSLSQGPNSLIKQGATLIDSANEILKIYNIDQKVKNKKILFKNKSYAKIYSLLQTEPMKLVDLSNKLNIPLSSLSPLVSKMEIDGIIKLNNLNQLEII